MFCPICKQDNKTPHPTQVGICEDCATIGTECLDVALHDNTNWMQKAESIGIEIWERQPDETEQEYRIWCAYRDQYPHKMPTLVGVVDMVGIAYSNVRIYAKRWNFKARLSAWVRHAQKEAQEARKREIVDMNKKYSQMSHDITEKLQIAIKEIDPHNMSIRDLKDLMKMSHDIESKARTGGTSYELKDVDADGDNLRDVKPKADDIDEILQVLAEAGQIPGQEGKKYVGIRKTTEVILDDENM